MALLLASIFVVSSLSEQEDESSQNKYEFYCTDGKGDWSGIDLDKSWFIKQEKNNIQSQSTNERSLHDSISSSNIYDTYNSNECRRVRKSWNGMTSDERSLYINGLLELRSRGELDMNLDELVAIASAHDNPFGSVTHHDSDYLFWHGYLVWELESRIRNLGGKYKCFGMVLYPDRNIEISIHVFVGTLNKYKLFSYSLIIKHKINVIQECLIGILRVNMNE